MKQSGLKFKKARSLSAPIGGTVGLLLALALLFAAPTWASYEQLDTFGEGSQLVGANGLAVNVDGAGGVPAGTFYAVAGASAGATGILSYSAKGEFLTQFGPIYHGNGIAVDQATGNLYVTRGETLAIGPTFAVEVFSPDGSQLITSFGERGTFGETIDEGPEKVHGVTPSDIAVDSSGTVYLADDANPAEGTRVMVFEPQSPGDYEHYVYAGRARDIAVGYFPQNPALDSAGNLYVRRGDKAIYEFAPGNPTTPICEYQVPAGSIQGMTVNPASGEVFYFTYKNTKIHQLSPCNSQGEFVETTSFTPTPKDTEIRINAFAFNPALAYEPARPPGVLYGASTSGKGYIFAPPAVSPPSVESESVSSVSPSSATLGAQINPKGSQTRYAFQYITDAAYQANEPAERFAGAAEAPLGGAVLGSGQKALGAAIALVGLQPDTAYHYRAIATSHCEPENEAELCEAVGLAETFRTYPAEAPGLPDNRAYELVSPAQKYGGEAFSADAGTASCGGECKPGSGAIDRFPMQSAPDGEAVVYEGFPFTFTEGAVRFNEYLSRRTTSGWQTTTLSPLLQGSGEYQGHRAFNDELTRGILQQTTPGLNPEASDDYANLYVQSTASPSSFASLLSGEPPNRPPGQSFHLIYAGASADLSRVFFEANDALTGETSFAPEAVDGGGKKNNLYESVDGQLRLVNVLPGNTLTAPGVGYGSGKRQPNSEIPASDLPHAISADGSRVFWSSEAGLLYVRENGESTTAIPDAGKFLTASGDGSEVLLSNGHIYDLESEAITDLSEGKGGFQGIVGQNEDLSQIYFVDTAVLDEAENDQGAKAEAAKANLYAWDEGDVSFVATLLATETADESDWAASPVLRTGEASPDGRWVAFLSRLPLTGYVNNNGPCIPISGTLNFLDAPCAEAFLYDSASERLICASCNPSGSHPLGNSVLRRIYQAPGSFSQSRYLTDSGRLYFDTRDSLTPSDTNNGVEDVYQYEPNGIGSCKREGGCVSLISAGHEPVDSNFLAADATGKNVFFTSRDQLLLKDRDDLVDLYVAREGGGIAAETEIGRGECQGEACQATISPPNDPTPGSSTFEGAGNVDEKKATKKHKKKHKHAKKHKSQKRSHGRANHNRGGAK